MKQKTLNAKTSNPEFNCRKLPGKQRISRLIQYTNLMARAMDKYQHSPLTTGAIAAEFGISTATLTCWAKKSRIVLRSRGRRKLPAPSPLHRLVLDGVQTDTYASVGARFGFSKQRVHAIVRRWQHVLLSTKASTPPTSSEPVRPEKFIDGNEVKSIVITFRLTPKEVAQLDQHRHQQNSINQTARSLLSWSLTGRYKS